jgi:hypothetical protein
MQPDVAVTGSHGVPSVVEQGGQRSMWILFDGQYRYRGAAMKPVQRRIAHSTRNTLPLSHWMFRDGALQLA